MHGEFRLGDSLAGGIDRITFEVIRGALQAVCNEIGVALGKGALSMVINQGRDFSAGVLMPNGDLVMQGEEDFPCFISIQSLSTKEILKVFPKETMRPGDVYMSNDPYRGGTHKPDIRMCRPVFLGEELVAFVSNTGHWPDVGGQVPGSFSVDACDVIAEGLCIPAVKIAENDRIVDGIERLILANTRVPIIAHGDIRAMISSLKIGEARLRELFARHGKDLVIAVMRENIDYAERLLRSAIRELPEGSFTWSDYVDEDPGQVAGEKRPVKIELTVTVKGGRLIYDLTGSDPQTSGGVNATMSLTTSAVFIATKAMFPHVPVNEGVYRVIEIIAPEGSVVNCRYPAPVVGGMSGAYQRIVNCVFGCFSQLAPERVVASSPSLVNVCLGGVDTRKDSPLRGQPYVLYCWTEGGYGARAGRDNGSYNTLYASGTRNQPVEIYEQQYPISWEMFEMIPDSGGPGEFRGGLGVRRVFRMDGDVGTISVMGDGEINKGWGAGQRRRQDRGLVGRRWRRRRSVESRSGVGTRRRHRRLCDDRGCPPRLWRRRARDRLGGLAVRGGRKGDRRVAQTRDSRFDGFVRRSIAEAVATLLPADRFDRNWTESKTIRKQSRARKKKMSGQSGNAGSDGNQRRGAQTGSRGAVPDASLPRHPIRPKVQNISGGTPITKMTSPRTASGHQSRPISEKTQINVPRTISANGRKASGSRRAAALDVLSVTRRRSLALRGLAVLSPLALTACQTAIIDSRGTVGIADKTILIDSLVIMLAIVIPTILATFGFAWWFRSSNRRATYLSDWAYSGRIELIVWAIPLLMIILLGGVTWIGSHELDPAKPLASDKPPLDVQVVSLDWKWLFIYPKQGVASVNQLVIPAGTPIQFSLTSASVMNAFFVPRLGSMIYTMNGMATRLNLKADEPGVFAGLSSHFSGDGFAGMHFDVRAIPEDQFAAWVETVRKSGPNLDAAGYEALAKPSTDVALSTFRLMDPKLFERIAARELPAAPGPQQPRTSK